eukprot:scaffold71155_cov60-Phaeocystis_antarctica.AAC.1
MTTAIGAVRVFGAVRVAREASGQLGGQPVRGERPVTAPHVDQQRHAQRASVLLCSGRLPVRGRGRCCGGGGGGRQRVLGRTTMQQPAVKREVLSRYGSA